MLPVTYKSSSRLTVGVLLAPPPVQLLDLAPVDVFHMLSKAYLSDLGLLPQPVKDLGLEEMRVLYIADSNDSSLVQFNIAATQEGSPTKDNLKMAPLTADLKLQVTSTLSSPETQPGKLSILLIPGPDPASKPADAYTSFIRAHATCGTTDIITVCTGIYPACYSGICDGRIVTGPRGLLPDLRNKFKKVKGFEDKRWSVCHLDSDANKNERDSDNGGGRSAELWNAAGITNGNDCIAAYVKAHFNPELADVVCRMADIGDRLREYNTGQAAETVWWMSRILRTVLKGFFSKA